MKNKMVLMLGCALAITLTLSCKKQETNPLNVGQYAFEFTLGNEEYKFDVAVFGEDDQEGRAYYSIELAGHSGGAGIPAVGGFELRLPLDKLDNPRGEYRVGRYTSSSGLYPGSVSWEFQRGADDIQDLRAVGTDGGAWNEQLGVLKITDFVKGDGGENYSFKELDGTFEFDGFEYDVESASYSETPIKIKGKFHAVNVKTFPQP